MIIFIASCSIAVVISFLCSLAEAILLSTDTLKIHKLKSEGKPFASTWIKMKENVGRPIAAILILNTIAHTGGATIAAGAFHDIYGDRWLWLFSVLFTLVILIGTEILPKVIGVSYSEGLAPFIIKPLEIVCKILLPFIWLSELISKRFKTPSDHKTITTPQIVTLVNLARSSKLIADEQESIIVNAIELHNNHIENIMVPKEKMVCLKIGSSSQEIISIAESNFHTRYPIINEEKDISSYINIKVILSELHADKPICWEKITRPIMKVSCKTTLLDLLVLFRDQKQHIALAVNEENSIVGLVTMEDVIQEILGNENDSLVI